jgi:hypothetical protein
MCCRLPASKVSLLQEKGTVPWNMRNNWVTLFIRRLGVSVSRLVKGADQSHVGVGWLYVIQAFLRAKRKHYGLMGKSLPKGLTGRQIAPGKKARHLNPELLLQLS